MPELPEVETVKNLLINVVKDRVILNVEVLNKRQIDGDVNEFVSKLKNKKFLSISRRGKYLLFHLSDDLVMISHLRMEGKYFDYLESEDNSKYARVIFHLDNGHKLCYDDSRSFGILKLSDESSCLSEPCLKKLGPEPFDVSPYVLFVNTRYNCKDIKTSLLDQTLFTGLGNIYVDETLYLSKVHPHTPTNYLTCEEWIEVVNNAQKVLRRAIELGGSTIKSYHPGKDIDGNFQTELRIYGKKGETCPICGKTFLFTKTNGRGTTFCPGCQHKVAAPINVGLTGVIASGKSSALEMFRKRGAEIISADEIVSYLYKDKEVINKINQAFKLNFKDHVNHDELRNYVLTHKDAQKRLENIVHPLVRKEIENKLKVSKAELRVVEVPLLFKAHYEDLFDTIIVIDVSEETQLKRLKSRNGKNAELLKEINKNNQVLENKNKAEFLVSNDGNYDLFKKEILNIINILKLRLD